MSSEGITMKDITKVPTKNTKYIIIDDAKHEILYLSKNVKLATARAMVAERCYAEKIDVRQKDDPRIFLYEYKETVVGKTIAIGYGWVEYKGRIYGKMIDGLTHKKYIANPVTGQRLNVAWSSYFHTI